MHAVTGATGQLGRLVIEALSWTVPKGMIVAAVRDPAKAANLAVRGIVVREADYDRPETLVDAFSGVERLLLISSNQIGRRLPQHQAVISASKAAGVKLIAYTSVLHADTSPLELAKEHRETEALLKSSGIPWVVLRNGWYTENYLAAIPSGLAQGAFLGSANDGLIASATRNDYAEGAVAVLTSGRDQAGRVYELAGDDSYTLAGFAAELSRQSGKTVVYRNLPEEDYKGALVRAGLPEPFAALLAQSDAAAAKGALFDSSRTLSGLIGRPTTSLAEALAAALAA